MGNRGEQGGPKAVSLDVAFHLLHVLDQPDPLNRKRRLIHQGIEQAPLIRRKHGPGLVAVDTDDADLASPGVHRQEQALRAGKRIGAATGGSVAIPSPFGGRDVSVVEGVLRRISGFHDECHVLG